MIRTQALTKHTPSVSKQTRCTTRQPHDPYPRCALPGRPARAPGADGAPHLDLISNRRCSERITPRRAVARPRDGPGAARGEARQPAGTPVPGPALCSAPPPFSAGRRPPRPVDGAVAPRRRPRPRCARSAPAAPRRGGAGPGCSSRRGNSTPGAEKRSLS